jgi:hypothetical protein
MYKINKNQTLKLEFAVLDNNGKLTTESPVSVDYSIINSSTLVEVFSGSMEVENNIFIANVSFDTVGQYLVTFTTPSENEDVIETIIVEEENAKENTMLRALGLMQENYRIIDPVYVSKNGQACMTSATIKTYANASDCNSDLNAIATYTLTATFDNQARMLTYKMVKN